MTRAKLFALRPKIANQLCKPASPTNSQLYLPDCLIVPSPLDFRKAWKIGDLLIAIGDRQLVKRSQCDQRSQNQRSSPSAQDMKYILDSIAINEELSSYLCLEATTFDDITLSKKIPIFYARKKNPLDLTRKKTK